MPGHPIRKSIFAYDGFRFVGLWLTCCLVVSMGCQRFFSDAHRIVNVEGQVLLDGEPVAGARVLFVPYVLGLDEEDFALSYGMTDEKGNFQMWTADHSPGTLGVLHRVLISKLAATNGYDTSESELIPAIYNKDSELTFEVPRTGNAFAKFELTSIDPQLQFE